MSGYVRQRAAEIVNGAVANATHLADEFDELQTAFNNTIGHTHSGAAGEGGPVSIIGPGGNIEVTVGAILPDTDNTYDLGSTTFEYKDLYIDGTAKVDTLTVDENATVTGNLTVSGNTTLGNDSNDSVTINADVSSHVIPDANNTYDLGSVSRFWRHLYVSGTAFIDTAEISGGAIADTYIQDPIIFGGEITNLTTPLAIADGGTGGIITQEARTNLGLGGAIVFCPGENISSSTLVLDTGPGDFLLVEQGNRFSFIADATVAAASPTTVQIDNASAVPLKTITGAAIPSGYFLDGQMYVMYFDGTNMLCDRPLQVLNSGSNWCYRYANGLQICQLVESNTDGISTATGSLFHSSSDYTWNFLASFTNTTSYVISGSITHTAAIRVNGITSRALSQSSAQYRLWTSTSLAGGETATARLTAIGRWY